jgi:hypothetical protein
LTHQQPKKELLEPVSPLPSSLSPLLFPPLRSCFPSPSSSSSVISFGIALSAESCRLRHQVSAQPKPSPFLQPLHRTRASQFICVESIMSRRLSCILHCAFRIVHSAFCILHTRCLLQPIPSSNMRHPKLPTSFSRASAQHYLIANFGFTSASFSAGARPSLLVPGDVYPSKPLLRCTHDCDGYPHPVPACSRWCDR